MGRIVKHTKYFIPAVFIIFIIFIIFLIFACGSPLELMQKVQEEISKVSGTNTVVFNLTGTPSDFTNHTDIDITVGGDDIISYKYKLDSNAWSAEYDISKHITASGLTEGVHTLLIIGKHSSGVWQLEEDAESISWTVDTTAPAVINITTCTYSGTAGGVEIQWDSPSENVLLLRSAGTIDAPVSGQGYTVGDSIGSATVVYKGSESGFTDTNAGEGTRNYQTFAYDTALNYTSGGSTGSTTAFDGFIYVNGNTGSNNNSGISTSPKAGIQEGISAAAAVNIPAVRISEGTYQGTGPVVTLVEGVSIYGGYKNGDWSVRDPSNYVSIIRDQNTVINSSATVHRALEAGSGITTSTIVDGFTIEGSNGSGIDGLYASAVYIGAGGSPTIQNCVLKGGNAGSASETTAVIVENSSPIIQDNVIHHSILQNDGAGNNRGLVMTNSNAVVRRNSIDGDNVGGNSPYGIRVNGGNALIYNNTISNLKSSFPKTYGIHLNGGTHGIYNNYIDGGYSGGSDAIAIYITGGATPDIRNNIISGSESHSFPSYGIWEDSGKPQNVSYNDFINIETGGSSGGMYHYGSTNYTTIDQMQATFALPYRGITCTNNTDGIPLFDVDYRLTAGTSTSVSQGGANLSGEGFNLDKDKVTRTIPWSMGAYELDP